MKLANLIFKESSLKDKLGSVLCIFCIYNGDVKEENAFS